MLKREMECGRREQGGSLKVILHAESAALTGSMSRSFTLLTKTAVAVGCCIATFGSVRLSPPTNSEPVTGLAISISFIVKQPFYHKS